MSDVISGSELAAGTEQSNAAWLPAIAAVAVIVGSALRLAYHSDFEFKADEFWMLSHALLAGVNGDFPLLGCQSSTSIYNPGMSLWLFIALLRIFHLTDATSLTRGVECLNIAALLLLLLCVYRCLPSSEWKTPWWWTIVLASLNPFAVLFSRKIWAQDTEPLFCLILLFAWFYRHTFAGALTWGFFGLLLGQIHMSGFFFAAALFVATTLLGTTFAASKKINWVGWLTGTILGTIPLIPWLQYLAGAHSTVAGYDWHNTFSLRFWWVFLANAFGYGLKYSIGSHHSAFVSQPTVMVVYAIEAVVAIAGLVILYRKLRTRALAWRSDSVLALLSASVAYGLVMNLAGVKTTPFYLIVTFPFQFYALAFLFSQDGKRGNALLGVLAACQLVLSLAFLQFIHANHGAAGADYGRAYQWIDHGAEKQLQIDAIPLAPPPFSVEKEPLPPLPQLPPETK
ncbi:MAG TPA: hypothetical protein V6C81_18765 [Planktothrix sp.]|jgi:hypothetical protein